ncbi:MAG: tRNA preQ1(34) S-adenosylmethionine ribosyltransferase-isomerase QueA [Candidatus Omnitrophica bacterium]|nr:tRNA preQ1(34) S-adenosylmethionine ribosyltransferase-isomerase QueA [Candidatus Omnitrophota bacterium]
MNLTDFDYDLPRELIAQYPLKDRTRAKLLVLERKTEKIIHTEFFKILDYISEDDLLILNNTKVVPVRLKGRRTTGGKVEILLIRRLNENTFEALIKPSRLRFKEEIFFEEKELTAKILDKNKIEFSTKNLDEILKIGKMPLPPYIKREPNEEDFSFYQTVYAKEAGSIASPTAGLHFDEKILHNLKSKGVNIGYITLHIGYSSFKPLKIQNITQHKLEEEFFKIEEQTRNLIEETKRKNRRIFAVGTTSVRVLETYAHKNITSGYTDLYIYPGFNFKLTDCLITNFHLPKTSLFILVCAFAGIDLIKKAYNEAIQRRYRFLSYGDAMLIL